MKLSIFGQFGLKTPVHAPNFLRGYFTPNMGSNINETPERNIFVRVRVARIPEKKV